LIALAHPVQQSPVIDPRNIVVVTALQDSISFSLACLLGKLLDQFANGLVVYEFGRYPSQNVADLQSSAIEWES